MEITPKIASEIIPELNFDCPNVPGNVKGQVGVAATYRTYYDGYFYLYYLFCACHSYDIF